jgi:hypothetical protein
VGLNCRTRRKAFTTIKNDVVPRFEHKKGYARSETLQLHRPAEGLGDWLGWQTKMYQCGLYRLVRLPPTPVRTIKRMRFYLTGLGCSGTLHFSKQRILSLPIESLSDPVRGSPGTQTVTVCT